MDVMLTRKAKANAGSVQFPRVCHLTSLQGRQLRAWGVAGSFSTFDVLPEQDNSLSHKEMPAFSYAWAVVREHVIHQI